MMTNIFCRSLNLLKTSIKGVLTLKYSTSCHQQFTKSKILPCNHSLNSQSLISSIFEPNLRLTARQSVVDLGFPQIKKINEIIDNPININGNIIEPIQIPQSKEDKIPDISMNLPMIGNKIEKLAVRLIVIRRRKMKKHKLRKLRKKMKFVWRKVKQRRELNREKAFHKELLDQIYAAEQFDAKAYVASRLQILDNVRIPSKWRGEVLPEAMIRQFLKEKNERIEYRRNKPRLTL